MLTRLTRLKCSIMGGEGSNKHVIVIIHIILLLYLFYPLYLLCLSHYYHSYLFDWLYLSSARQSRVPATVRASKQGSSGGKKPSKIIQNSQQNGPKSRSEGGLGGPWAPLGRLLAPRHLWADSWRPFRQLLGGS